MGLVTDNNVSPTETPSHAVGRDEDGGGDKNFDVVGLAGWEQRIARFVRRRRPPSITTNIEDECYGATIGYTLSLSLLYGE